MAVQSRTVTVATTATRIDSAEGGSSSQGIAVYNDGAATVFLGPDDVTTEDGYPLATGEHVGFDLNQGDALYGIVASGTIDVRVLEVNV